MVSRCPDCGARVWPTAVRTRTHPDMPEFNTVTWNCRSCGWLSAPDVFIGHGGEGPAADWLTKEPPEDGPDDAAAVLSAGERAVVELIGAGLSNQQIADQLVVSINTVKSTIRSAYQKMHVESRPQAMLWAIDHGLVDPRD